ncbi:MAG: aspartate--ammonia ligase [Calditrichaceae bacterium]|nr:aspartate--ammonia ligase [Calditrichaceae bacterium]MBN2709311.1 aspartate--ammonia ligase [Calditrichaceae bacterium]RQV91992.1 MAG: aspartate--ammonia ligase [Calditrichota bacterium]
MSRHLNIPKNYKSLLSVKDTERAIRLTKDFFQTNLSIELNLTRVTAPLFVQAGLGINDDLNGIEKPVSFKIKYLDGMQVEIVQSLAKWKRMMLKDYGFSIGDGLYTDMNAIRPDETLDNLHSIYVDQWDWELAISQEQRNTEFLKKTVRTLYEIIRRTEKYIYQDFPAIKPVLPEEITFFHSEELEEKYPGLTPFKREELVCEKYGAVFIIGIGHALKNGKPHDQRAPDYDDWSTADENGKKGLNGDILVYNPVLRRSYELSSMGIRVNPESLMKQLALTNNLDRKNLLFHKRLLNNELPLSIGGGIGQSRLCMFYLRKAHIGEIQAGIWSDDIIQECRKNNIFLL